MNLKRRSCYVIILRCLMGHLARVRMMELDWRIVAGLILMSIGSLQGKTAQAADSCPGPNASEHDDGTYDFTYESWVRKYRNLDHYDFGRCVFNKTRIQLRVIWEGTNIDGYADPVLRSQRQPPTGDVEMKQTRLWYGAALRGIDVELREPRVTKEAARWSWAPLLSLIRMAIPSDAKATIKALIQISMVFESRVTVSSDGRRYRYAYTWRDLLATPAQAQPFGMRWESRAIGDAMRESDIKTPFTALYAAGEAALDSPNPPEYRETVVVFLDAQGQVVGKAPTSVYVPTGTP